MPHFVIGKPKRTNFNPFLSPYFYVVALILGATLGLYLVSAFIVQRSRITLLAVPRSESASSQAGPIIENLLSLSRKLSFYDRILFDNPEIADPYAGLSKDERKEKWNRQFTIERNGDGTMLDISVYHPRAKEAEKIARQFADSLAATAGQFYDIRSELEIRTVEGPITAPDLRSPLLVVSISFSGGILLALLIFFAGHLLSVSHRTKQRDFFRLDLEAEKRREAFDGKILPHLPFPAEEAKYEPQFRRSAAPPNLPVAEDLPIEEGQTIPEELTVPQEAPVFEEEIPAMETAPAVPAAAPLPEGEPTEAEYRERLNKLLRGGM